MMRVRGYFWLPAVLSSALLFPSTAAADTIRITGGFVEMPGEFNLLSDDRGFRFFGRGYGGGGSPNGFVFCEDDGECNPGDEARFAHAFGGLDLPGQATLDGVFHDDVGSLGATASAEIGFSSTHVLPPLNGGTAVLRTPFAMQGSFFVDGTGLETLVGSGFVTTTWTSFGGGESGNPIWNLTSARYDFFGGTQVPEPTTLLLVGTAAAAAAFRKRRQSAL